MSKHSRASSHMEISLKESTGKGAKRCHCDVTLFLPHETIVIKESTVNMFAAIDIAETKFKIQLKKYKDLHDRSKLGRHLLSRSRRQAVIEPTTEA